MDLSRVGRALRDIDRPSCIHMLAEGVVKIGHPIFTRSKGAPMVTG
jgi:hypothetical protein